MKKKLILSLLLTLCLCLLLSACGSQPAPAPDPTPEPDPVTDPANGPDTDDSAIDPNVKKYFEYFETNVPDLLLLWNGGSEDDIAANRAAYVLLKLACEEEAAGKEVTFSYPQAEFDRAAMDYLGEPITRYETRMTTVTPEGNVASTGWGMFIPNFMVMDKIVEEGTNQYRGSFSCYANPYGQGEDIEESYEDCRQRLMRYEIRPTDYFVGTYVLEWTEWESPLLGLQLRYSSVQFTTPDQSAQ